MEYKVLIRRKGLIYKVFKIRQGANSDITIIPNESIYLDREFLTNSDIGDEIVVSTDNNEATVDHFSAHSETGQRHIKYHPAEIATEPIKGAAFKDAQSVIPLISVVVSTTRKADGEQKGKTIGFDLPIDTDYCTFDLFAIPLGVNVEFNFNYTIHNEKVSQESFDRLVFNLRTVAVALFIRTTNHNNCSIPYNVFIQQDLGKSAQIVRVSEKEVRLQVSTLTSGRKA